MPRFISAFLIACALFLPSSHARAQQVIDQVAAVVGDEILLRSEVDALVIGLMRQQEMEYSDELWDNALSQMVDERVLVIHARRDTNLVVSDDQVDQMLDSRIAQMSMQVGGESRLEEFYGKTVVEIKAELREDFRDQILADQYRSNRLRSVKVTPTDVTEWFNRFPTDSLPTLPDRVRLAHIVRYPAVTEEARREAREILGTIRDTLLTGSVEFEEMAELFSEDPGSASNGGRYESMSIREVVPEFAAVASRMPVAQISQIFETPFGLHILRVNDRRGDQIDYNHILIKFDESKSNPQDAIDLLSAVRDTVVAGDVTFAAMARRHSEEEATKLTGGQLRDPETGERSLYMDALGPDWQATLRALEPGDISQPSEVELLNGRRAFHIVLLQARIPEHRVDLETDYALIQQYALREKQNAELSRWLDTLREEVYIDIRLRASDTPVSLN